MKSRTMLFLTFCGFVTGFCPLVLAPYSTAAETPAAANQTSDQATAPAAVANTDAESARLSPALQEIVKLTKAGVDDSVVLAYIRSSRVAYHPSAQEIIKLREEGVSSIIITAVLDRRKESLAAAAPTPAADSPTPQAAYPPASAYSVPSPAPVVTPTVVYTEPYYYPSVGWYGYGGYYGGCYPRYYSGFYPRVGFYGSFPFPGASIGVRFGGHGGFGHAGFGHAGFGSRHR